MKTHSNPNRDEVRPPELSIKQNMVWNSVGSVVNLGCQWLISIVVVRLSMGFDDAGLYSLAMAIYGIFSPIAQYRMYTYQITDVRGENTTGEYFSFRLITNAIALVMIAVYSMATCSLYAVEVTLSYSFYRMVALTIDVFHACDQCNHRMDYIGKSLIAQGLLTIGIFTLGFYLMGNLCLTFLVMGVAVGIWGILYDYRRALRFAPISFGISCKKIRGLLMSCLPVVAASVAAAAAPMLPRQVLSSFFGSEALGIYASVAAPVAIIQMSASYIYNPLMGYFSEHYANRSKKAFSTLFVKCTSAMLLLCVLSAVGVALFGKPVLVLLYGDSIAPYSYLLYLLIVLAIATGYMWFVNDLLIALRNFKAAFAGNAAALCSSIVGLPFVFLLDMNGVTVCCLVSSAAGIVLMLFLLVRQLKKVEWK